MEWFFFWLVMAGVVAIVANSKGRPAGLWFLYGMAIWPIALVHILVTERTVAVADQRSLADPANRKCPFCAEVIKAEAIVCRHCGRDLKGDSVAIPVRSLDSLKR